MRRVSDLIRAPRFPLLAAPTPLRRLARLEAGRGPRPLYVKRDDLMEVGLGGNKLRSLEFWIGAAKAEGADILIAAGGAASNQCRLTAAAAAVAGLDCLVLHSAAEDEAARFAAFPNRIFGAEVRFLGPVSEDDRARLAQEAAGEARRAGRRPYVVGDPVTGALGYVLAAEELWAQSQAGGHGIRHVFLAGSMGPTEAGFVFGNALLGFPFTVHLVSVEYDRDELAARVGRICDGLAARTGLDAPALRGVEIHMGWLGEGYGLPTPASEAAILTLARTEGVVIEHVYTAKTFAAFLDLAGGDTLPEGEPACAIHTGGTAALFTQFGLFRTLGTPGG